MKRKPLIWKLYPSYLLITISALATVTWFTLSYTTDFYYKERTSDLKARAVLAGERIVLDMPLSGEEPAAEGISSLCEELGRETSTRITVVRPDGLVICDSEKDPSRMDNHSDRPEINAALSGRTGSSVRYSYTLKKNLMYVAVPLAGDPDLGVVRAAIPVSFLEQALAGIRGRLVGGALIAAILAALVSFGVSRRLVRPLKDLKEGVVRFAEGDLGARLQIPDTEEFATLAEEMNRMAAELEDRIGAVEKRRSELDVILASMVEGLIAFDSDDRITIINEAAGDILGLDIDDVVGRSYQEIIRNADLQSFIAGMGAAREPMEDEIHMDTGTERLLQVHGTILKDSAGRRAGTMVVLNDITRLRKLERIRRDFVANASHEIRTPVTAIKGSVETLLEGADQDPRASVNFLNIISRHSDRLSAIVEDLLSLSRIEKEVETGETYLEEGSINDVLEEAVDACRMLADAKNIQIHLDCPDRISARIDHSLLVLAVTNLLDNAVKYSSDGGEVHIGCETVGGRLALSVQDNGHGISKEHIPRLFERFYRVDSSRSRKLGGTGLGLAIVKHIAQAHGGDVQVKSVPGEGSTFMIILEA